MLRDRLLYGPIFIALLIAIIWGDEAIARATGVEAILILPAVLAVSMLAALEITLMVRARGIPMSRYVTVASVALGVVVASLTPTAMGAVSGVAITCSAAGLVLFVSMAYYARHRSADGVIAASGSTVLAFVYAGLMAGFFVVLSTQYSPWVLLGVLLVTKSCDIGAYFTGTAIGRTKLIVWLSPKKTWEGLAGGVATSTLIGAALVWLAPEGTINLSPAQGALVGGVFGLVGQAGDLMASLVKRDMGAKDASKTLPGFGGVLDVLDSPLLVAPVAYWMLAIMTAS